MSQSEQSKNKKVMLAIVGIAILVMGLVGATYAFFNYTRTGSSNVIKTGKISFDAAQNGTVTLSDLFPITVNGNVTAQTPGVGSLSIHVTGDTTYDEGIEYLIKAVNVTDTNGTALPISIQIGYEASEGQGKTIGTEDEDYFDNRGGNTSRYQVLSENTISEGENLVVGYIAPGQTGIDGNLIIMAYLDARNIAITDTYPEEETDTNNDGYIDGTTDTWVNERTVFTTQEWNALQANGVSFQVKVEANQGIWVEDTRPVPTIDTCPGCKFMYTENIYYHGGANNANATVVADIPAGVVQTDYRKVITNDRKYFLGFTETQDGKIDRAFACGIKGEEPNQGTVFCIEGSSDGSTYISNRDFLNNLYGVWDGGSSYQGCEQTNQYLYCNGIVISDANVNGDVVVESDGVNACWVGGNNNVSLYNKAMLCGL